MDLSHVIITTERLKLVPVSKEYASDIFREFTEEITKYMSPPSPKTINDTLEYIRSTTPKMLNGEELPVAILSKETGEFLGGGGVHALNTRTPEFGIWIKKS